MKWALLLVGGAALTWWAFRITATPLEPSCARALARAMRIDPARVTVGEARPSARGVVLSRVTVGSLRAQRVEISFDLFELALRRARPENARVVLRGVETRLRGLPVSIEELAIEVADGRPRRAAFSGGRVGPLAGLSGSAVDEGGPV